MSDTEVIARAADRGFRRYVSFFSGDWRETSEKTSVAIRGHSGDNDRRQWQQGDETEPANSPATAVEARQGRCVF